jgi:hypothetical protein
MQFEIRNFYTGELQASVVGVWTPWAQVICLNCHGRGEGYTRLRDEAWARRDEEITTPGDGCALTTCDQCGRDISVDATVATEHELAKRFKAMDLNASMQQTGGMCSAAAIWLGNNNDDYLLFTHGDCGSRWNVGFYSTALEEGEMIGGWDGIADADLNALVVDLINRYTAAAASGPVATLGGVAW